MNNENRKCAGAVLAAVGVGAATLMGMQGYYSAQEATSTPQQVTVTDGDFTISITPGASSTWNQVIPNMSAGDVVTNYLQLHNNSQVSIGDLKVVSHPTGVLTSGATPVGIVLTGCDAAFDGNGNCGGKTTALIPNAVTAGTQDIKVVVPAGGNMFMKVTTTMPNGMGNEYQGKDGSVSYTFTATQLQDESSLPTPESR